ncbi:MAG: S9 family peptidase [bacterium]|nr:S9 family peptidase [bacterium]
MRSWLMLAASLLLAPITVHSEPPATMSPVDLISTTTQRGVQFSSDGRQVLFTRSAADWHKDKRVSHIWRVGTDGSGLIQMTNGAEGEASPKWSPEGTHFAFTSTRGGEETQIWLQPAAGGEAMRISDHKTSVEEICFSPDGAKIYFLAHDSESEEEKTAKKIANGAYSFDRDFKHKHLWMIDIVGFEEKQLTEGDFSVLEYDISTDGRQVVYHAGPTPLYDNFDEAELWVRDVEGGEAIRLTENSVAESDAQFSPDGKWVLFIAEADRDFVDYHQANLFIVPAKGGKAKSLILKFDHEVLDARWSADMSGIVVRANVGVRGRLYRLSWPKGKIEPISDPDENVTSWSHLSRSGRVAYFRVSPDSPGDIWLAKTDRWKPRRLTTFGEVLGRKFQFPRTEIVHWKGRDGVEVEGILYHPIGDNENPAPLVVQIHGGPASSSTLRFPSWSTYVPTFTARGWAVLQPNYRGSTGYGDDFLRDMVGHYFNEADGDVLTGIDALIEQGIADPERLAIMGWSAGGHMTNWLITQTDRFKAASSGAGASNWISMYGQSDVRSYRTPWFLGTPWQPDAPLDVYMAHSPITHVSKAKTPTLILVGEKDPRVPMAQSVEMFRGLRSNGVETELVVFPDQPHGPRSLKHQLHKMNVELAWLERHVLGREYEHGLPPGDEQKE